jgi:hypothetical protein
VARPLGRAAHQYLGRLGAATFVVFAALVPGDASPTRVAAQVVSGIGFLGAGLIFRDTPDPSERYIFPAPVPGPLSSNKIAGATAVPQSFSHHLWAQQPIKTKGGMVPISDSSTFPVSTTIAAALVDVEPGGMRELHWHPNTDEWQYYIEGARMGVFGASGQARTFDFRAETSVTCPSPWDSTPRTPATRRCAISKCSRAATSPMSR